MRSQALDDLRAEHRFMGKLLDMLQTQVRLVAEDRRPDGDLLLEIAQYFASFPDLFHHPKEDLLLGRLAAAHPGAAETIQALEAEHEEGGQALKRFIRAVVKLVLHPEADQDRFLSAALAFIESERRHMTWEEKSFFLVAERALSPRDWEDINARLRAFINPLCQREAQTRYERIDRAYEAWCHLHGTENHAAQIAQG
jgi:hemerythrin-like domain-containing protein